MRINSDDDLDGNDAGTPASAERSAPARTKGRPGPARKTPGGKRPVEIQHECSGCGGHKFWINTSNTEANPDRDFYKCAQKECGEFAGWRDEVDASSEVPL
ncbi:MAG: hypothetical protein GTN65_01980 [Armatimonadetes bacterium]|nr:hypothetical protein [Armatimonadota bacterium]NIO95876.1 hypothetical protein [Armatimonadota bacterium]